MEELTELRNHIAEGRYAAAMAIVDELEEMSRDDKINRIESHLEILLLHLIKKHAEKRTTRSWDISIYNAVHQINKTNKRRKSGGYYLKMEELADAVAESFPLALKFAAMEAFGGAIEEEELAQKIDAEGVRTQALKLIAEAQQENPPG